MRGRDLLIMLACIELPVFGARSDKRHVVTAVAHFLAVADVRGAEEVTYVACADEQLQT